MVASKNVFGGLAKFVSYALARPHLKKQCRGDSSKLGQSESTNDVVAQQVEPSCGMAPKLGSPEQEKLLEAKASEAPAASAEEGLGLSPIMVERLRCQGVLLVERDDLVRINRNYSILTETLASSEGAWGRIASMTGEECFRMPPS